MDNAANIRFSLLKELEQADPNFLSKVLAFVQSLKKMNEDESNTASLAQFAGSISDQEAQELKTIIQDEFSSIEGEW